jgi:hypothetical protein
MKRRQLLRGAAALPFLSGGFAAVLGATAPEPARRRLRRSDSAWPSATDWARLKQDVGGNLLEVHELFGSCRAQPSARDCLDALKNIRNPYWIGDQPAGTEVSGWLDAWTPAPSVYAIKARHAQDVAAGVNFARHNNLRLVIKGGSHSYLGTSNAPDSLLIWTRAMKSVALHSAFVGQGCAASTAPVSAVSCEAGALWMDLYDAVTTAGARYVQGGGCTTVGVAGLVQSGGFGSFSKAFGTAASGLLEAEIVTADGQIRIVNACTEPDLFWAIKGGGGGSFGVLTRLTLRTHELPKYFGYVGGKIRAYSEAGLQQLIARFIEFYRTQLLNPHWGEQVKVSPDNTFELSMVCQGLDDAQVRAIWQPFFDWVGSLPGDYLVLSPLHCGADDSRGWWNVANNSSLFRDMREGAPKHHGWWHGDQDQVGVFIHGFESIWLPASTLDGPRPQLADALFAASRHKQVQLHINKGLAGAPPEALEATRQSATNPAVLDAFALAIIADAERPSYPGLERPPMDLIAARNDARDIDLAAAELAKLVTHPGSYVSESNYFNRSWQLAYWGSNYPRLRRIKSQYDPNGLFFVHHGVGSEDWSADGFTRL